MWYDPHRAVLNIQASPAATPATSATPATTSTTDWSNVAIVAEVAAPNVHKQVSEPTGNPEQQIVAYGLSVKGNPRTWTGRVVPMDAWMELTFWDRNGPAGRHWSGITKQWEKHRGDQS